MQKSNHLKKKVAMEHLNKKYKYKILTFWRFTIYLSVAMGFLVFLGSTKLGLTVAYDNFFTTVFIVFIICVILFFFSGGFLFSSNFFSFLEMKINGEYSPILQKKLEEEFKTKFIYFDAFPVINGLPYAIGYNGHNILVVEKGTYSFLHIEDIKDFYWKIEGFNKQNTIVTGSIRGSLEAITNDNLHNTQNVINSVNNSGMYIKTNNVQKPIWFLVFGIDTGPYHKWEEIFNQILKK